MTGELAAGLVCWELHWYSSPSGCLVGLEEEEEKEGKGPDMETGMGRGRKDSTHPEEARLDPKPPDRHLFIPSTYKLPLREGGVATA